MVREARRLGLPNARFVRLRAEELPAELGSFRILTLAQSFHWFETADVARSLFELVEPGGALVHVGATTHEGDGNVPREEIARLIEQWLGPERRAGAGVRRYSPEGNQRRLIEAAGFRNRRELDAAWEEPFSRSEDDVVASVFSLSYAAPHLFGERRAEFEQELRALLRGRGPFQERPRPVTATIWDR